MSQAFLGQARLWALGKAAPPESDGASCLSPVLRGEVAVTCVHGSTLLEKLIAFPYRCLYLFRSLFAGLSGVCGFFQRT